MRYGNVDVAGAASVPSTDITNLLQATNAEAGRSAIGANNASNLTSGILPYERLPAGTIIQSIVAKYATDLSLSTTVVDTGLEVTITPRFSNSLIQVHFDVPYRLNDTAGVALYLNRDTTLIEDYNRDGPFCVINQTGGVMYASYSNQAEDSPGGTSTLVYKLRARALNAVSSGLFTDGGTQTTSGHIKVQEIKQ